jgi:hypothetical protein
VSDRLILVTPYVTAIPRVQGTAPRLRYRWRAELVFDNRPSFAVEGYTEPDAAIGALIREAVSTCETHEEVVEFFASMFGDTAIRSADVTLSRAVRYAAGSRHRKHPGVRVQINPPVKDSDGPTAVPSKPARLRKGGAL